MFKAEGIIPAVVSPVDDKGNIRETPFRKLLNYLIDNGVHGLFINGSQGEFYALTSEEKQKVLEIAVDEVNGRVPVYAGVGAVTTREAVKLAKTAEKIGAQALSAITPYYIKPDEDELYDYYKEIAESVSIPVLLYANPSRTNIPLSVKLVSRLSEIDNIVGIKDSSGDLTLTGEYIRLLSHKGFQVLAGRDTLILGTLVYGGTGAIAATANVVPRLVVSIYEYFKKGDLKSALEAQYKLAPLRIAFDLGTFPVVIKEAVKLIGFDLGSAIRPVKDIRPEKREELRKILVDLGLSVVS
ncbi:4-hydroxy-tetrahydrodipicolinate synthase [bacterium]|nr:4-hydroxy-tetrahydrodipicolinate synthase [bacterium]